MSSTRLQLLGDFQLVYADEVIREIDTPRLRALVAYLALHRNAPQPRYQVAYLLWPDSSEAQAMTNLRKQLLFLRTAWPGVDRFIAIERQTLQWRVTGACDVDVAQFEEGIESAKSTRGFQTVERLRHALDLYHGDLLPSCYDDWIFHLREQLRAQYADGLTQLVLMLEEQRDYESAIAVAQRLLRHDPIQESTYRSLMRLHALNGERALALRLYHTCFTQLQQELGVVPSAETQAAYKRLLHQPQALDLHHPITASAPLVGRQSEWQALQQAWRRAACAQAQVVLITGEPGIGKTRLAAAFLEWASHQGMATARARSYAAEGTLAYAPIVELLRADDLRTPWRQLPAIWRSELGRLLPEALSEDATLPQPGPLTDSWQRQRMFEALARAVLAGDRPLVLLLDDLQWCDQETIEWLHFLLRFASTTARHDARPRQLLILGAARAEEIELGDPLSALLADLRTGSQLFELELEPLNAAETNELVKFFARDKLDPETSASIYRETEGNPLFVVEMLRVGRWQPAPDNASLPPQEGQNQLPPKIQAVIHARLAQLSPQARQVAALAAIIGREFTFDLLAAASHMVQHDLVDILDELWRRRIVREQGFQAYDFSHDRIRDVAALTLSAARRQLLHRNVAEAMEALHADAPEEIAAQIAAHYEQAGLRQNALSAYQRAAEAALRVYANYEAIAHLQRALSLLQEIPEGIERDKLEFALLLRLGPALTAVHAYAPAEVLAVYERAHQLTDQFNDPPRPEILRTLGIIRLGYRDFEQVAAWGMQLLEVAGQETGTEAQLLLIEGHYVLGVTAFWRGSFLDARDHLALAVQTYGKQRQTGHVSTYAQDPGLYCSIRLAWTLWYLGYPDQAKAMCAATLARAEAMAHPFTLQLVLWFAAWIYQDCRDPRAAEICLKAIQHEENHRQLQFQSPHTLRMKGWYAAYCGDPAAAIANLTASFEENRRTDNAGLYGPFALGMIAQVHQGIGEHNQGLVAIEHALGMLGPQREYWYAAELLRIKGELLLARPNAGAGQAEQCFSEALAIAQRQHARALALRSALALSRLWQLQDRRSEALTLLRETCAGFSEGFDAADFREVIAVIEKLQQPW